MASMVSKTDGATVSGEVLPSVGATVIPRALTILLGVAALFVAAQAIQPVRMTIAAAFMALNLVIVVWPIQAALVRWRCPRFLASFFAGLIAIAVMGALVYSVGWTIARLVQELPQYSRQFSALQQQVMSLAQRLGVDTDNLAWDTVLDWLRSVNISTIINTLEGVLSGVTSFVGLIATVLLILVFMIMDSTGFAKRMERLGERHNPTLAWALGSFAQGTRKYWIVTTVFGLIVAICNWGLLVALGVPLAMVWALMSFVTNYIPNIGFIIGIIPPALMALLANDPLTALWVVIGYYVFNTVLQTFIQPKFTGDAVGITPTIAVISLLLWSYILGAMGAILAIPATLFVKTLLIDIDPNARWMNVLIASNPKTSDQDPMRLSNLLARAKRARKLKEVVEREGVESKQGGAAAEELAAMRDVTEEAAEDVSEELSVTDSPTETK